MSNVKLNLEKMHEQKRMSVSALVRGIAGLFKKNGVQFIHGRGEFKSKDSLIVHDEMNGGQIDVRASKYVIATGSLPAEFAGLTIDEKSIVTSTGALDLPRVPNHLVIIGGGIIGLELGSVWNRLGAKVTVIEYLNSIGAGMDAGLGSTFLKTMQKQGMTFKLSTKVEAVQMERKNEEYSILCTNMESQTKDTVSILSNSGCR